MDFQVRFLIAKIYLIAVLHKNSYATFTKDDFSSTS